MGRSRVQVNKAHKTRFSSKSSRNLHRTSLQDSGRIGKSDNNYVKGAKAARVQRGKMLREQKRAAVLKEKRASGGLHSAPRVIVLFPLSASVELNSLGEDVLKLLSSDGSGNGSSTVASSEYKLRATVLKAPHGDLLTCMEMAKVADLMAFVASASAPWEENSSNFIDSFGSQCLSVFRSIGLPSTTVLIRELPSDVKKKNEMKKMCASQLASEFPEDCKFYPADTRDELHKFMWLFKAQRLTAPHWRSQRPYVVAQKVGMLVDDESSGKCTLVLSGYLRARKLSVNQLVHVSGVGDFQFSKIEVLKDPFPLNERKNQNSMELDDSHDEEVLKSLVPDPMKQEPLVVENTPDPLAGEQTWPTEEEMAEADKNQKQGKVKKKTLPRGTSEYQAAWIVDETDEEDSDNGDSDDNSMVLDRGDDSNQKGRYDQEFEDDEKSLNLRDIDTETQNESEMMDDEDLTEEQIKDEIKKIKEAYAEDEEFPDEVETPIDVPARRRFAKYRGLKSFRTSSWDPNESLPQDYARIFAFDNVARTQKLVLKQARKMEEENRDDCVPTGSYVRLHIKEVPLGAASKLSSLVNTTKPIIGFGLLQHESKMSVLHFSVKKYDGYEAPIKTKEELMFHVGFRQFIARPVFSTDNFSSDKHKMERFLHPGRFSLASIYGPISFPPLPLVVLKISEGSDAPAVAALGSLKSVDTNKIILKKIILTGYPQRVSKMKASVRYMFHNPEDVKWFKPVEVWSKCGRRGRVKEPVGTHGAMKCIFNGVVQQHDIVCMNLYKRAYPKWPERLYPQLL
ncbi:Ribosome biogenesis protein BMS1/TSR1 C-terminal [Arabidopsis thaliana x Arabidopsis arenosa]|uniref:Ribosome biogenesis protein BMS1/TSR1 C-terminal n=1 Tax=Arabidopsis thaliana x Arabidopsis arenosa TaxID=1240361 RepID=A0A8T2C787_9BRAS|nr:Ribosome biogenesis protein BMS1/TSR1 C-terminal [Arabidopsis thaliana x Arabidopsis arenosa]